MGKATMLRTSLIAAVELGRLDADPLAFIGGA
jgi:hypothetical protein